MPEPIHSRTAPPYPPLHPDTGAYPSPEAAFFNEDRVSLCDMLDRLLNKGVVVAGEVTISVADIDLLYLGVNLILTSIETAFIRSGGSAMVRLGAGLKGSARGTV